MLFCLFIGVPAWGSGYKAAWVNGQRRQPSSLSRILPSPPPSFGSTCLRLSSMSADCSWFLALPCERCQITLAPLRGDSEKFGKCFYDFHNSYIVLILAPVIPIIILGLGLRVYRSSLTLQVAGLTASVQEPCWAPAPFAEYCSKCRGRPPNPANTNKA